jgi:hypothetical protein
MTAWKALLPAGRAVLAVALLATAGLMWSLLPTKLQSWAPIDVHGTVGQRVTGRDIAVTVSKSYLAREVTAEGMRGLNRFPSKGVWLVMVISYEPLLQPHIPFFRLKAEERTFSTSLDGFGNHLVQPEMPSSGPIAYELPAVPRRATLLVSNKIIDNDIQETEALLDSRVAVAISLPNSSPLPSLNLDELARR